MIWEEKSPKPNESPGLAGNARMIPKASVIPGDGNDFDRSQMAPQDSVVHFITGCAGGDNDFYYLVPAH